MSSNGPMDNNTISVVSDIDGKKYKLVMKGDMRNITIGKIKKHLAAHCHLPIEAQVLTFNGTIVDNMSTGEQVGLFPGAQLRLSRQQLPPPSAAPSALHAPCGAAPAAYPPPQGRAPPLGPCGREAMPPAPPTAPERHLSPPRWQQPNGADHLSAPLRAERMERMISGRRERELEERCARLERECSRLEGELAAAHALARDRDRELERAVREAERLQHEAVLQQREIEVLRTRPPPRGAQSGIQLARQNLAEFGQELGVQHELDFDENMTCVVGVEQKYTILLTYDQSTERLYMYSTLLTYLPKDEQLRLRLFETLLEGALLGRDMSGGGVGVSVKNELILMAASIDLRHSDSAALRDVAPQFVESLIKWRAAVRDVLERHARTVGLPHSADGQLSAHDAVPYDGQGSFTAPPAGPVSAAAGVLAPPRAGAPPVSPASYARAFTGPGGAPALQRPDPLPVQYAAPQPPLQPEAAAALHQLDAQEREIMRQQQLIQQQRDRIAALGAVR
eukprot:TRINITY_DN15166_c0_g1_i2.p1 TRINITY_DN15166_c0_g1~~TRINITY_DN15166_c0_g1_i2.p1  ORF type:complete len:508 (+),score=148.28 TRINITY_DN15166_c0_g1_i2:95-1618(+)